MKTHYINQPALIERLVKDDPVRPGIPAEKRLGRNAHLFITGDHENPTAVTCVSYTQAVPTSEDDLFDDGVRQTVAVFYTIWSYKRGAARGLLIGALDHISRIRPEVKRFVTLSPKTVMAQDFHLGNGAYILRENKTTINYEYHPHRPFRMMSMVDGYVTNYGKLEVHNVNGLNRTRNVWYVTDNYGNLLKHIDTEMGTLVL
jgi:hypothetical protein